MASTQAANITAPAYDAARELHLALVRYQRLASPPRHLLTTFIGDLAAYQRAQLIAIAANRVERARELGLAIDDELTRRARLEQWAGRSSAAWNELVCRLWCARAAAVEAGVLDRASESYRVVSDRFADAKREAAAAERRQRL